MFLRRDKKPATGTISRPTNTQTSQQNQNTVKALAGFDDEVEVEGNNNISNTNKNINTTNIFEEEQQHVEQKKDEPEAPSSTLYSYSDLSQMDNLEYEVRLVQQILQPGGIKVKPNESLLNQFSQAAKTLDKNIIGSLLISRLEDGFPYQVKAKSLYTIQYLSKKNDLYKEYFNLFSDQIKAQPQPEDNVNAYRNLINQVLSTINEVVIQTPSSNQVDIFEFNGPNYNNDLPGTKKQISNLLNKNNIQKTEIKKQQKVVTKKFISPSEAKKIQKSSVPQQSLIDTTTTNNNIKQQAPKAEFNIFQLDLSSPQQQPKVPISVPIQIPQIPSNYPMNFQNNIMSPAQQQQYQQQQQYLYQQQFLQQQQKQQQTVIQNSKQITGDDLYSMYKKL